MQKEKKKIVQYGNIDPVIKKRLEELRRAYTELQSWRGEYERLKKSYENVFSQVKSKEQLLKDPNIIKSHFTNTAVEIFIRGMRFPDISITPEDHLDPEDLTMASLATSYLHVLLRLTGFEEIYNESKEDWASYGDAYRRPFKRRLKQRGKPQGNKMYPQYEDMRSVDMILDIDSVLMTSESVSKSATFAAYTRIYSEGQIIKEFGREIIEHISVGASVDHDRYALKVGQSDKKVTNYYEVIVDQDCAGMSELVLIGANAFPYVRFVEGDNTKPKNKIEDIVFWKNEYPHFDEKGESCLTFHNSFFYFRNDNPRNRGLVCKLYGVQVAHELIENLKLDATRLAMFNVPTISGGSPKQIANKILEWEANRETNLFAWLHLPGNVQNGLPKVDIIAPQMVSRDVGAGSSTDMHDIARNSTGVSLTRLEILSGEGLGQTEIREEEKVVSIEAIVDRNIPNLVREIKGLINYGINNNGFGLTDMEIRYSKFSMKNIDKESVGLNNPEIIEQKNVRINFVDASKKLKGYMFRVFIDKDTIVNRSQTIMADRIIKAFGVIDPAALPEVAKGLMKKLLDIMRIDTSENAFDNISRSVATGGDSQFKGSTTPQAVPQSAVPPAQ